MPVLTPTTKLLAGGMSITCLYFLPASVILLLVTYILKRRKSPTVESSPSEKVHLLAEQQQNSRPALSHFTQPTHFSPPPALTANTSISAFHQVRGSEYTSSPASYSAVPFSPESPNPTSFTSFNSEMFDEPRTTATSTFGSTYPAPNPSSIPNSELPRRRSYTKTLPLPSRANSAASGAENAFGSGTAAVESSLSVSLTGEIVSADGWRRHTRVYGGGVCIACEESEGKRRLFEARRETR